MNRQTPQEKWKAHRPRVGDTITCKGREVGKVVRVEGALCWRTYQNGEGMPYAKDGEAMPFIWCFRDTLNNLHEWPNKEGTRQ